MVDLCEPQHMWAQRTPGVSPPLRPRGSSASQVLRLGNPGFLADTIACWLFSLVHVNLFLKLHHVNTWTGAHSGMADVKGLCKTTYHTVVINNPKNIYLGDEVLAFHLAQEH